MDTSSYEPPKHVIKPAKNDTGYKMVRKAFKKLLTWDDFTTKYKTK